MKKAVRTCLERIETGDMMLYTTSYLIVITAWSGSKNTTRICSKADFRDEWTNNPTCWISPTDLPE